MTPPGRASTSQSTISAPCGPNQREKCSAWVHTSNTSSRGASKTRVNTISSSTALASALLFRTAIPLLLERYFFALFLQPTQIRVETIEARLPEATISGGPSCDLAQRSGLELTRPPLRLPTARDEAGVFEHAQMLRHGRPAHRKRRGELRHGGRSPRETREDR